MVDGLDTVIRDYLARQHVEIGTHRCRIGVGLGFTEPIEDAVTAVTSAAAGARIRIRTCIATRRRYRDEELLRIVVDPTDPTRVIPDPARRLPGRGAWITPTLAAIQAAEKRRSIPRALRVSTAVDTSHVHDYVASLPAGTPGVGGAAAQANMNDNGKKTEH